jgi:hypothetical protein
MDETIVKTENRESNEGGSQRPEDANNVEILDTNCGKSRD